MEPNAASNNVPPAPAGRKAGRPRLALPLAVCGLACLALTGCRTTMTRAATPTAGQPPENIFKFSNVLPSDIRRVAVLPLASLDTRAVLLDGRDALQPVLLAELIKTKRFEVVPVSRQVLRSKTGREFWSASDTLPADFFALLCEAYDCDAVLFAELTEYRAYAPVAVGWRLRLVDARTRFPLWAGDELFDARRPEAQAAARRFLEPSTWFSAGSRPESGSDWARAHSPRTLAQYAVAQMFDTLPAR